MTIRLAIIGAGLMGSDHARIFAEDLPGACVQVVCDASAERARSLADRVGAVDVMSDAAAAVARADVDAVVIASPDATHAPLSLACIAAGKRALCEKPLSQSVAQCQSVLAAEQAAGARFVQLGFMRRYDQSYAEMKSALDAGDLGRALMMHNFHRNVETPATDFTGAMAITNSAPHEFDVARFVLGGEFSGLTAFQPQRSDARVAPVVMVLDTVQGQIVTIEINNNAAYGYDVRAELVGEAGSIATNPIAHTRRDAALTQSTRHDSDWRARYAQAYRLQNRDFLAFVATGHFPVIAADAWDGYAAACVAAAGVQALAQGHRAAVQMMARPAFYARPSAQKEI